MNSIKREIKYFIVAGISAVGIDLGSYYLFLEILNPAISKGISFLLGTIVAFLINKYLTFEKHDRSFGEIIKFAILYTSTLIINVATNEIVLNEFHLTFFAFFIATGVSTVLNFIGQKWWVFR